LFASGYATAGGVFLVVAMWCPDGRGPVPSVVALRDEVVRLLPGLVVGVSPVGGQTLVNFRTLFWVDTPVVRVLGRSRLVGFPVELRVRFSRARFDFGDGAFGVAVSPGARYDAGADCGRCAERFGHSYSRRARVVVSARVSWTAEFRIGAGGWLPISGEVDGPPATAVLVVRESHGVLVTAR
jgi:hypothetical protein